MASRVARGGASHAKVAGNGARDRLRARLREELRRAVWGVEGQGFSSQYGRLIASARGRNKRRKRSASRANLTDEASESIEASGFTTCGSVAVVPLSDIDDVLTATSKIAALGVEIDSIVLDARGEWLRGQEWIAQLYAALRLLSSLGLVCVVAGPSPESLRMCGDVRGGCELVTRPTLESAIWTALQLAGSAPDPSPFH